MKIGYNQSCAMGCSTLEKDLELCEKAGFDYIEIRDSMLREYLKTHTLDELAEFFASHHLKPHAYNAVYTYLELFSPGDDPVRQKAKLDEFKFACEANKAMGAPAIVVVAPLGDTAYNVPFAGEPGEIHEGCVRILKRLSDIAGEYGQQLCFELVGAPKSSVRSIGQADEIVREVNRANVGFVFDSCNIYMNGGLNDFSAIAKVSPDKIFAVHINDYDDVPVSELRPAVRCFPGKGVIDLGNFLSVLKEVGYNGMVSVETFRPEDWERNTEDVIKEAYATTREILEKYGCL